MGDIQGLVLERGININHVFRIIDDSTMELFDMKKFLTENPFMLAIYIVLFTLLVFEWGI